MAAHFASDDILKATIEAVQKTSAVSKVAETWYADLDKFLAKVEKASEEDLQSESFLKNLWEDTTVASTGNGSVIIAPALADNDFRSWFAAQATRPLPNTSELALAQLVEFYDDSKERLKVLCTRIPHLKLNRVFCALYPEYFTTIADGGALRFLHRAMGGNGQDHPIHIHKSIRTRIESILGPAPSRGQPGFSARLALPWFVYEKTRSDLDPAKPAPESRPASELKPLPSSLRRKGLTSIKGYFSALLETVSALQDGLSRDDFEAVILQNNPELTSRSVGVHINVYASEFDLCRRDGETYQLSPRGINLLETQEPDELCDHLLTRVFGIDHVLVHLSNGPESKGKLVSMLQMAHPGWTTTYAPTSLLSWLVSLGLTEADAQGRLKLTERGQRWRALVTWALTSTKPEQDITDEEEKSPTIPTQLPDKATLEKRMESLLDGHMAFEPELVTQLHAGLWFHPVRHFSVLTGISGSGKTQLALNYAFALCGDTADNHPHVRVIPVQPGWYDPTPLLGYVNPLQESSYRMTPFLEVLLRAASDPGQPYAVILDELNLSHPEQYLAPILSAMETHDRIELHQLDESLVEVRRHVRYPANLAIIGTVNMDETTVGLSDKVLDRAFTLEFWNIQVDAFPGWAQSKLPPDLLEKTRALLNELVNALAPVRQHFGWRTISDVLNYLSFSSSFASTNDAALDEVIYAKVLPKLRGESSQRFEQALKDTHAALLRHNLKRCGKKVSEMQADLKESGSARYWR